MSSDIYDAEAAGHERWRPRTRTVRRRLVMAYALALVLTAAAGALPDAPFLTLLGILAALGLGTLLRWSVRSTADLPDDQLDERLVTERDSAYRTAYSVVATVLVLVAVGLDIAGDFLAGEDQLSITGALLPSMPPLALFAPSAVLAWRWPDE